MKGSNVSRVDATAIARSINPSRHRSAVVNAGLLAATSDAQHGRNLSRALNYNAIKLGEANNVPIAIANDKRDHDPDRLFDGAILAHHLETGLEVARDMEDHAYNYENETNTALERVAKARDAYNTSMKKFRGEAENDVQAIKSQGARIVTEYTKVTAAATTAVAVLTSEGMQQAIANAQALATALESINRLEKQSVTFCVMGADPK